MNVRELIAQLQGLDQEQPVMVSGYEGGVTELTTVRLVRVNLNVNSDSYYGPHEIDHTGRVRAVLLPRSRA